MAEARLVFIDDDGIVTVSTLGDLSGVSGVSMMRTISILLTNAQIKLLPTTPVEIVPTPGAGKAIHVISGQMRADCRAGAYTNISGYNAVEVGVLNAFGTNTITASGLLGSAFYNVAVIAPFYLVGSGDYEGELTLGAFGGEVILDEDLPLNVIGYNASNANFTGGHDNNSLKVTVYYTIVDV